MLLPFLKENRLVTKLAFWNPYKFLKEIIKARRKKQNIHFLKTLSHYFLWTKYTHRCETFKSGLPWLTFEAIQFLNSHIKPQDIVFEYGGGASSIYFANKAQKIITVEHDEEWFQLITAHFQSQKINRWEGKIIPPEKSNTAETAPSCPDSYLSQNQRYEGLQFKTYASFIDQFPDASFDVVLIDGRARTSCLRHSVKKVKVGGLLIFDNAERPYYQPTLHRELTHFELVLNEFGPVPYSKTFSQTNIYLRKS